MASATQVTPTERFRVALVRDTVDFPGCPLEAGNVRAACQRLPIPTLRDAINCLARFAKPIHLGPGTVVFFRVRFARHTRRGVVRRNPLIPGLDAAGDRLRLALGFLTDESARILLGAHAAAPAIWTAYAASSLVSAVDVSFWPA